MVKYTKRMLTKLKQDIKRAIKAKCLTARALARISGQIVAMCKV